MILYFQKWLENVDLTRFQNDLANVIGFGAPPELDTI